MSDWDRKQVDDWSRLYDQVVALLARYGVEDSIGNGDYLVVEDNYGWCRIQIAVQRLRMFDPTIVTGLRALLAELPGWEISMAVDVPDKKGIWPAMGLTIRKCEIIDGLQRQYLPAEFQNLKYAGGKPGTAYD